MHKKLSPLSLNSLLRTQSSKQPLKLHENQERSWLLPQQRLVRERGLFKHKVVQQLRSRRTNIVINQSILQATYIFAQTFLLPRHNFKIKRASRQVKACWQQQRPHDLCPGMGGPCSLVIWRILGRQPNVSQKETPLQLHSIPLQQLRFIQGWVKVVQISIKQKSSTVKCLGWQTEELACQEMFEWQFHY